MSLTAIAAFANVLSFVIFIMMAAWYVAPWLRTLRRAAALTPLVLVWVNAFRHVALQIYSAQHFGFGVPDGTRDHIAAGDVIGMALASAPSPRFTTAHAWLPPWSGCWLPKPRSTWCIRPFSA